MRSRLISIITLLLLTFAGYSQEFDRPYQITESLSFRVKYGWFTIGKAKASLPSDTLVNAEPAYKAKVILETAGMLGFFNNTEDTFDGVVYKDDFKPIYASQNFQEGRKRDIQTNYFDYKSNQVTVHKKEAKEESIQQEKVYALDSNAFDLLSAYLYLRNLDFKNMSKGDSTMMTVFFGKKHYDFGLEYDGIETIKTDFGKIKAHKLYVLFPISKTFPEPKSVMIWTTLDENTLPLKIKAKLKFGQVTCELEEFENLKIPFG